MKKLYKVEVACQAIQTLTVRAESLTEATAVAAKYVVGSPNPDVKAGPMDVWDHEATSVVEVVS